MVGSSCVSEIEGHYGKDLGAFDIFTHRSYLYLQRAPANIGTIFYFSERRQVMERYRYLDKLETRGGKSIGKSGVSI